MTKSPQKTNSVRGSLNFAFSQIISVCACAGMVFGQDGMIDPIVDFQGVDEQKIHAPNAQSQAIIQREYVRMFQSVALKGESGKFQLLIEPRSSRWAAVIPMQDGNAVESKMMLNIFSADGRAVIKMPSAEAGWCLLPGEGPIESVLDKVQDWTPMKPSDSFKFGPNQRLALKRVLQLDDPGMWWLKVNDTANGRYNPQIWVNGKKADALDPARINISKLAVKGENVVICVYDSTRPALQRMTNTRFRKTETELNLHIAAIQAEEVGPWGVPCHPLLAMEEGIRLFQKTTFFVFDRRMTTLLGQVFGDFSELSIEPSKVQYSSLLDGPTAKHGFCRPSGNKYVFDSGKQGWFWGGHENHPPSHEITDRYVESYRSMGVNVLRDIFMRYELVRDYSDNSLDPSQLEKIHYLIYRLGQAGISFHLTLSCYHNYKDVTDPGGTEPGIWKTYKRRKDSEAWRGVTQEGQMTSPRIRALDKSLFQNLLTSVNPYNNLRICDDPTVMTVEIINEVGLGERKFNWIDPAEPEFTKYCQHLWNRFLLSKYGPEAKTVLAKQWAAEGAYKAEDPARDEVFWPEGFNGDRKLDSHHNRWYLDEGKRIAHPRISDAMECLVQIQEDWLGEMFKFLKESCGVKVGIGASSDGYNIYQVGARRANARTLDVTDGQAYGGTAQITAGYGGWSSLTSGFYVYNRPAFAREWSSWFRHSNYPWQYFVLAAVIARYNGYDGFAHHKLNGYIYPLRKPAEDPKKANICPDTDMRRSGFALASWILQRSKIEENKNKIILGFPKDDACYGGANRIFSNHLGTGFLTHQLSTEEYHFDDVYDGPADRIVFHVGRGPTGNYTKARHAILWSHGHSDRFAQDFNYKDKWFAQHGIQFKTGESFYLDDHYLAFKEDIQGPNAQIVERKMYEALKKWGYPLPFSEGEINRGWWSPDRKVAMEFDRARLTVDREDFQLHLGKNVTGESVKLSWLEASTEEKQLDVAYAAFDTAEFKTSRALMVWCMQNAKATLKLPFNEPVEIYAVNHLGSRMFRVKPVETSAGKIVFNTARSFDISHYEIIPKEK